MVWCDEACSLTWAHCHLIFFCEGSSSHVVDCFHMWVVIFVYWHSFPYMGSSFPVSTHLVHESQFSYVFYENGTWKDVEYLNHQIVEMGMKKQGKKHPSTLTSMENLAVTYQYFPVPPNSCRTGRSPAGVLQES